MPTIDQAFKNIGESLKSITRDVAELKQRVNRMSAQDGGGFYLPMSNYGAVSAGLTVATEVFLATIPKQLVIRSWKQAWYVATSDVSNYWTVRLNSQAGTHFTFTTQPANGAANVWNRYDFVNQFLVMPESYRYVYFDVTKVGTPGALYLGCPMVYCV